jgi:hypothetical protein
VLTTGKGWVLAMLGPQSRLCPPLGAVTAEKASGRGASRRINAQEALPGWRRTKG